MTLDTARDELASAILRAVQKRGRPNSFSCAELEVFFGGPSPTLAGRIGRRHLPSLRVVLARRNFAYPPTYADGRFDVP